MNKECSSPYAGPCAAVLFHLHPNILDIVPLVQVLHLSCLTSLQRLTLHKVPASEFSHCCRLNCYMGLSHLSQLRVLRIHAGDSAAVASQPGEAVREPHLHFLSVIPSLGKTRHTLVDSMCL